MDIKANIPEMCRERSKLAWVWYKTHKPEDKAAYSAHFQTCPRCHAERVALNEYSKTAPLEAEEAPILVENWPVKAAPVVIDD